jgi:hypothetical protein
MEESQSVSIRGDDGATTHDDHGEEKLSASVPPDISAREERV